MLKMKLCMPDIALVVLNATWEKASPLYTQDKPAVCTFNKLMRRIEAASKRYDVVHENQPPSFLADQPLSQNQVAYLLHTALSTWQLHHGQITQKMLTWACDGFSWALPDLSEADIEQALERMIPSALDSLRNPLLKKHAPYEFEKAKRKLSSYRGKDPVEFSYLLIRETSEALQRAEHPYQIGIGRMFRR